MVRILIALGGNAIKQAHESGTKEEQMHNCDVTSRQIAKLMKSDPSLEVVITHGNGPQSGNLALQQDLAKAVIPPQPLDIVGAMTQGQIGYMFQNRLQAAFKAEGIHKPVVCMINQTIVSRDDKEFIGENASKPVGNFMTEEEAMKMKAEKGWIVKHVKPTEVKGWRRVVPCPDPLRNQEAETAAVLVKAGVVVIASGGGGIPVVETEDGLEGVEAVIDKDLAGACLARAVEADIFMILTDVDSAVLNYGKPEAKKLIGEVHLDEMKKYFDEGHFSAGSMGPKVRACMRHVEFTKKRAIIASLDEAIEALEGKKGTHIVP
ncbi:Carbamate kinase [Monocercomonoides exilis]|uniref:Carbamate kinase n=1 Tax=Monocercomonoides exilis TaxID=2049356 RepID=A0A142D9Z2_9EUKA|nr:carbamate kinase [Monocercomonoides exilis]KAH7830414.1 Carbamate kinase [Monocercomonoides exilis]|eukprot:MONOS_12673.1-p1 / transcript=MONOS_12673.1 / gene=MONOS_12673 / organism=Monocercomonoides_exilis_PA203 / gene_product=Carbamate kinase [EC:2.7.2.2] / transcript_product=Carbamate kinase [EC:2.7.2.2] / location=Mono_scaffold00717:21548-22647(-) / protein_length=320 / sequence_SO=supercontig / SO=protein_coding / is_pseudo=false